MCHVGRGSVLNWIDRGLIAAYRTPGGHRRVTEVALRAFLQQHGKPIPSGLEGTVRILLVDDDEGIVETLAANLSREGRNVRSAPNGIDALLEVGQEPPEILVLDLALPVLDGFEVVRRLRARPRTAGVRIVAISGHSPDQFRAKAMEAGADRFLAKPFRAEDLEAAILDVLSRPSRPPRSPPELKVLIERGEMMAALDYIPASTGADDFPEGEGDLLAYLSKEGVNHGVERAAVAACLEHIKKREAFRGTIVARGRPPTDGLDARFQLDEVFTWRGPVERDDGSIDFREQATVLPVGPGDVIGVRHPATPGEDGFTVTGKVLRAKPGLDRTPATGAGVRLDPNPDGTFLYRAEVGGSLRLRPQLVEVVQRTVIEGDIDYSTGNIRCKGDLEIRGGVGPGFKVQADGHLMVHDVVEGAEIRAGGDVTLKSGVKGQSSAVIECGGTLRARYIERATVRVKGDLEVEMGLLDSNVTVGGRVLALKARGAIVGGTVRAGRGIEANRLGSDHAGFTRVELGVDHMSQEETRDLGRRLKEVEAQMARFSRVLSVDILTTGDISGLPERLWPRARKAVAAWRKLREERSELAEQRGNLMRTPAATELARIRVRFLAARVRLQFPRTRFTTDRSYENVIVFEDVERGMIRIEPSGLRRGGAAGRHGLPGPTDNGHPAPPEATAPR